MRDIDIERERLALLQVTVKAYDPNQPRYPVGHPEAGKWRDMGRGNQTQFAANSISTLNFGRLDKVNKRYIGEIVDEVLFGLDATSLNGMMSRFTPTDADIRPFTMSGNTPTTRDMLQFRIGRELATVSYPDAVDYLGLTPKQTNKIGGKDVRANTAFAYRMIGAWAKEELNVELPPRVTHAPFYDGDTN